MNKHTCMEKDCSDAEHLVECRLPVYKGDMSLWQMFRFHGLKAAWSFWRHGWYDEYFFYCADHCQKNGFCYGCGEFWAGSERFDFGPGYCSNCASEFEDDWDDGENDYPMPDDYYAQEYEAEPDYDAEAE